MADKHAAFISYAHRDQAWVKVLQENLERCLAAAGRRDRIFLDTSDLPSGSSWLTHLQAGLGESDHLILVATPEALASPWVDQEWQHFLRREPDGLKIHIAFLADAPLPPFLEGTQRVDFQSPDAESY